MKTIIVKAQFECVVLLNGQQLGVLEGGELKFQSKEHFVLTVFPLNHNALPYSVKFFQKTNQLEYQNQFCEVTKLPMNHYEIDLLPYFFNHSKQKVLKKQALQTPFGTLDVSIKSFENSQSISFEVFKNQKLIFEKEYENFENAVDIFSQYLHNDYFVFLQGGIQDYQHLVAICFDGQMHERLELLAHQIEIEADCIKTMSKCFDICKHGKVNVYKLKNANFYVQDSHLVLLKEQSAKIKDEFVPYAFFENLKVGDLKQSRTYLTNSLSDSVDDAHLKAYFGNFLQVRQNLFSNQENSVLLIYKQNNEKVAKVCTFTLENGKIDNLELLD